MDDLNGTIDPRCLGEPPLAMDVIESKFFFLFFFYYFILGV